MLCKGICTRLFSVQKPCTANTSKLSCPCTYGALRPTPECEGSGLSGEIRGLQFVNCRDHTVELSRRALNPSPPPPPARPRLTMYGRSLGRGGGHPPISIRAARVGGAGERLAAAAGAAAPP